MTLRGRQVAAFALLGWAAFASAAPAEDAAPGDPALGEKVFAKCRSCHQIGPGAQNFVGPELNGLIGRHTGSVPGYDYSDANKNSGLTWDEATFRAYIRAPQAKIPGTKMTFAGLTRESEINNIVAYLKQFAPDGTKKAADTALPDSPAQH